VTHHLVGVAEIADLLKVSPTRVRWLADHEPDFPDPEANLRSGPVWLTADVERWRDERPRQPPTSRPARTDYSIHLTAFDRLEQPDKVMIVRLQFETAAGVLPFERQLDLRTADRVLARLQESVTPARAERSLRWALAHEGAAALGREIERAGDPEAVPAVDRLERGRAARVTAAARQAAERRLDDIKLGTVLRVSAF
jgi:hypothetical protein